MLLLSGLVMGLALICFSFSSSWPLSLALIVFIGLGQSMRATTSNTLLLYYSRSEYRGRVISVYEMEFGMTSFGTFFAALLSEALGVQWAVGGFAMVLVLMAILALALVPRLRNLD